MERIGKNVLYVLWLRDMKRFVRARSRIIGMLMMPVLFLLGFGLGLNGLVHLSSGSYLEFVVPGIIGMSLLFTAISSGTAILWDRQFGFLKEIMVTPNSRSSIVIGRMLGGTTTAVIQSLGIVIISLLIGFSISITIATPLALLFMMLTAATFISIGLIFGSIINDFQGFQLVTNFVTLPLFFLSNGIFPLSSLPWFVQDIAYLNPLTYGVDGIRGTLTGVFSISLWADFTGILVSLVIAILLATYAFNRTEVS